MKYVGCGNVEAQPFNLPCLRKVIPPSLSDRVRERLSSPHPQPVAEMNCHLSCFQQKEEEWVTAQSLAPHWKLRFLKLGLIPTLMWVTHPQKQTQVYRQSFDQFDSKHQIICIPSWMTTGPKTIRAKQKASSKGLISISIAMPPEFLDGHCGPICFFVTAFKWLSRFGSFAKESLTLGSTDFWVLMWDQSESKVLLFLSSRQDCLANPCRNASNLSLKFGFRKLSHTFVCPQFWPRWTLCLWCFGLPQSSRTDYIQVYNARTKKKEEDEHIDLFSTDFLLF